jgi:hypothetical protein
MRWFSIIILGLALGGCAARPQTADANHQTLDATGQQRPDGGSYAPAPAQAMAFDSPVLANLPQLNLSRDGRDTAAYAGYQSPVTTYYYLEVDDNMLHFDNDGGSYGRDAVTQTFGATLR